jgi:hypothetical protein
MVFGASAVAITGAAMPAVHPPEAGAPVLLTTSLDSILTPLLYAASTDPSVSRTALNVLELETGRVSNIRGADQP